MINNNASSEPSAPYSLDMDGSGDVVTSVRYDLSSISSATIDFHYELGGYGEAPDSGDYLRLEYFTTNNNWTIIWIIYGQGNNNYSFSHTSINLPKNALHKNFQFRFVSQGSGSGFDDFFVDNLYFNYTASTSDWLTFSSKNGSLSKNGKSVVGLWVDATKLSPGLHQTSINILSNDKRRNMIQIPLTIRVYGITLTAKGWDIAPDNVHQFQKDIIMANYTITSHFRKISVRSISLNLTGSIIDKDVASVRLVHDVDCSGNLTEPDILLGAGKFEWGKVRFPTSMSLNRNSSVTLLVLYNLSYSAQVNGFVGVRLSLGDVKVVKPAIFDLANNIASPVSHILERIDQLAVSPQSITPDAIIQGQDNILLMRIDLHAQLGKCTVNSLDLELIGTCNSGDISTVKLYHDLIRLIQRHIINVW